MRDWLVWAVTKTLGWTVKLDLYLTRLKEGENVRGRPPVTWRDRVQEYVRERGEGSLRNLEQARRVCQDRERWKRKSV